MTEQSNTIIVPPLKWAGGKRWLPVRHAELMPAFTGTYHEPFFGGGAVFFYLSPSKAVLSDMNADLITTYIALRDDWRGVYKHLKTHASRHTKEYYYAIRSKRPPRSNIKLAAWFLYMNRACYNGLYRVNRDGKFNVPIGTKDKILLESDNFSEISNRLRGIKIQKSDFEAVIDLASEGDFVYIDPPYTVKHNKNGFLKYNEDIFSWSDQERLAHAVRRAATRGVKLLVSNADHVSLRELYGKTGTLETVERHSLIGGGSDYRSQISEIAVRVNY